MADIQIYINNILNAVYGEEVRASLVNALTKINADNEKYQAIKEEIVTARDTVVDQMIAFDEKYDKAIQAVTDLLQATSAAATIQNNLQVMVNAAGQKMDELDTAVGAATSQIADAVKVQDALDIAIGTAAQTKEALDESNVLGAQAKTALDAAIKAADTVAEELRNTLASINTTAEEQLSAIRNAGTAEVKKVADTATEQTTAITSAAITQLQNIRTAGAEEVEKVQQATAEAVKGKLDKQQGAENAGKALVIGADGNVVPGEVAGGTVSDAALELLHTIDITQQVSQISSDFDDAHDIFYVFGNLMVGEGGTVVLYQKVRTIEGKILSLKFYDTYDNASKKLSLSLVFERKKKKDGSYLLRMHGLYTNANNYIHGMIEKQIDTGWNDETEKKKLLKYNDFFISGDFTSGHIEIYGGARC